jgi:hypothetical protein
MLLLLHSLLGFLSFLSSFVSSSSSCFFFLVFR